MCVLLLQRANPFKFENGICQEHQGFWSRNACRYKFWFLLSNSLTYMRHFFTHKNGQTWENWYLLHTDICYVFNPIKIGSSYPKYPITFHPKLSCFVWILELKNIDLYIYQYTGKWTIYHDFIIHPPFHLPPIKPSVYPVIGHNVYHYYISLDKQILYWLFHSL